MLNPPRGITNNALKDLLATGWDLEARDLTYAPLGFGTHHWDVRDSTGARWFLNVDELEARRLRSNEPLSAPLARLRAALSVPRSLRDHGMDFAVAPVPDRNGDLMVAFAPQLAASLYPYVVDGESFKWAADGWASEQVVPGHLRAVLRMLAAVH